MRHRGHNRHRVRGTRRGGPKLVRVHIHVLEERAHFTIRMLEAAREFSRRTAGEMIGAIRGLDPELRPLLEHELRRAFMCGAYAAEEKLR